MTLEAALEQIDRAFGKARTGALPSLPGTMTERVARELCRQHHSAAGTRGEQLNLTVDNYWQDWIEAAKGVFAAMGAATDEMLDTAEGWQPKDQYENLETERERIAFLWDVMLTDAEEEYDEQGRCRADLRAAEEAEWDARSPEEQRASWADWSPDDLPF